MAYNTEQKQGESIEHWYKRLAKTADQRLVRLEGYRHEEYFKNADKWSYTKAMKDIKRWSGDDATRFNTKMPEKKEDALAKISDMRSFLESPTSTKKGILEIYKKRAETFNRETPRTDANGKKRGGFGTKFTWQDIAKYYESGIAQKWSDKFGSDTALRTIAVIQKNKKKIQKAIETGRKIDIRVEDKVLNETVNKAIQDENLQIEMFF